MYTSEVQKILYILCTQKSHIKQQSATLQCTKAHWSEPNEGHPLATEKGCQEMLVNTFVLKDYHTCLFLSLFFVYYVMDIENGSFAMNVETGWDLETFCKNKATTI